MDIAFETAFEFISSDLKLRFSHYKRIMTKDLLPFRLSSGFTKVS